MADDDEQGPVPSDTRAGGSVRRRLWLIGVVVVAVALVATVSGYALSRHSTHGRTPLTAHTHQVRHGSPCGLRVVESGVTRKNHYVDHMRDPANDLFLASAIIENPCKWTATNASFVVTALDSQGHQLVSGGGLTEKHFTVVLLMPGQRAAGWTYFTRQAAPDGVAKLSVRRNTTSFGPICWIDPAKSDYQSVADATDVTVGKRNNSRTVLDGSTDLSFKVTWSPDGSTIGSRVAVPIFRDRAGRLLDAGGDGGVGGIGGLGKIGAHTKLGQREHLTTWAPPNADPARTEVFLEAAPDSHGLPYTPSASCLATSP